MAIQPIDLQTLFTQIDKVGRAQLAEREGLAIQQAIQGTQLQRRTDEQIQSVNETQNLGEDGVENVKDRGAQTQDGDKEKKAKQKNQDTGNPEEESQVLVFRDPRLGRNIDISL